VVPSLPSTVEMILMSLFRSAVMMLMAGALKNCRRRFQTVFLVNGQRC
jgi:hypothetical protein